MSQHDMRELIDRYLDHSLTEPQAEVLRDWLNASEQNMRFFADYMLIHTYTHQHLVAADQVTSIQQYMQSNGSIPGLLLDETDVPATEQLAELPPLPEKRVKETDRVAADARAEEDEPRVVARFGGMRVYRRTVEVDARRRYRRFAAAAVIGFVLLAAWWAVRPEPVATLTQQHEMAWGGDTVPPALGDRLTPGRYRLEEGFAKLQFDQGASVLLESPVEFELSATDRMVLLGGKLTADASNSSRPFVVSTPNAHMIDLGTEFGVGVARDGAADVAVFEGAVLISGSSDPYAQDPEGLAVVDNQQASVDREGVIPQRPEPLDPAHHFTRTFSDARDRLTTNGPVLWYRQNPPRLGAGELVDPDHFVVMRERTGLVSDRVFEKLFFPHQKRLKVPEKHAPGRLPEGVRFDSYLIHWDRAGDDPQKGKRLQASITFPRPIVAIVYRTDDMYASDREFGHPHTVYEKLEETISQPEAARGLETHLGESGFDYIVISDDRRTIKINWQSWYYDQARVLIESE